MSMLARTALCAGLLSVPAEALAYMPPPDIHVVTDAPTPTCDLWLANGWLDRFEAEEWLAGYLAGFHQAGGKDVDFNALKAKVRNLCLNNHKLPFEQAAKRARNNLLRRSSKP